MLKIRVMVTKVSAYRFPMTLYTLEMVVLGDWASIGPQLGTSKISQK